MKKLLPGFGFRGIAAADWHRLFSLAAEKETKHSRGRGYVLVSDKLLLSPKRFNPALLGRRDGTGDGRDGGLEDRSQPELSRHPGCY